jgi:hypothetical protein
MFEAYFYFVNCDYLEQLVTSRGLVGEWRGNDHYKVFNGKQRIRCLTRCLGRG